MLNSSFACTIYRGRCNTQATIQSYNDEPQVKKPGFCSANHSVLQAKNLVSGLVVIQNLENASLVSVNKQNRRNTRRRRFSGKHCSSGMFSEANRAGRRRSHTVIMRRKNRQQVGVTLERTRKKQIMKLASRSCLGVFFYTHMRQESERGRLYSLDHYSI